MSKLSKLSASTNSPDATMSRKAKQIALSLGIDTTYLQSKSARTLRLTGVMASKGFTLQLCKLAYGSPKVTTREVRNGTSVRHEWKLAGLGQLSLVTRSVEAKSAELYFVNKS